MSRFKLSLVVFSGVFMLAACGGGSDSATAASDTAAAAPAVETAAPAAPAPATTAASDTAAPTAEKLYGTWEQCESEGSTSSRRVYKLGKDTGNDVSFDVLIENFPNATCDGASTGSYVHEGFATLKGEKKAKEGAKAVKLHRISTKRQSAGPAASLNGQGWSVGGKLMVDPDKVILTLSADELRVGDRGGSDGEGYPDQLRPGVFKKK